MAQNIVADKSYVFALSIINVFRFMVSEHREYVLSKQLLRSGTAVGALIREAEHARSNTDFVHKMSISLKEANETLYWLRLLRDSGYLPANEYDRLFPAAEELVRLLVSIVKTMKRRLKANR